MRSLSILLGLAISTTAFAQPQPPPVDPATRPARTCFQVSADGKAWLRTPQQLCVSSSGANHRITLESGDRKAVEVASFSVALKHRVRCADCNKDVFAVASPVFGALEITFDGKRDLKTMAETGTVTIGKTTFHYRNKAAL